MLFYLQMTQYFTKADAYSYSTEETEPWEKRELAPGSKNVLKGTHLASLTNILVQAAQISMET